MAQSWTKTGRVTIRISDEAETYLVEAAEKAKRSMADYVRGLIEKDMREKGVGPSAGQGVMGW